MVSWSDLPLSPGDDLAGRVYVFAVNQHGPSPQSSPNTTPLSQQPLGSFDPPQLKQLSWNSYKMSWTGTVDGPYEIL